MSGIALDVPARAGQPSFLRVLWAVLLGYVGAALSLVVLAFPLDELGLLPRPFARPGPFPVVGAWSLDADVVFAVAVVLAAAWWIRWQLGGVTDSNVSFGVVAAAVALTGFAPYLALRPIALSGIIALPATTWLARRYAIGRTLPLPRPSWRVWALLAVAGVLVAGSYRVYHPLSDIGGGAGTSSHGGFRVVSLQNSGWANVTIERVQGGSVGGLTGAWPQARRLPYTVPARGHADLFVRGTCLARTVVITFSVLGRMSTQQFAVPPDSCSS